jgi:carboxyl-terminal processing protease
LLILLLIAVLAFGAGFAVSAQFLPRAPEVVYSGETPGKLGLLGEVWRALSQKYVDKGALNADKLGEGAIRGILEALGDPYTAYLDAEHYKLERSGFQGSFEGIGAVVGLDEEGELIVISPIANSPAERAGIRAKDKILAVDGEPTAGMNLVEAVNRIRGPRGTEVWLTILHQGELDPVDVRIVRDEIKADSVYLTMLPDNIAYIRITYFSDRTNSELSSILKDISKKGAVGIILDLRGNPGGLLTAAVEVASQFLKRGVVVYQLDNEGERRDWEVRPGGLATDIPLAVLVDKSSASGSEVVAGALQDAGRAPLIGERTFGKGSVWEFYELSDGSALAITVSRWFTPKGRLIEGEGLNPDFEVEITEADLDKEVDPQLERALDYLKSGI